MGLNDRRLSYSDSVLTYAPAPDGYYGEQGETLTASFSVSDTVGCRLEDYTWSFKLGLEPVLGPNVLIIDAQCPLTLLSVEADTYTFSYSGDSCGVCVGDIFVSTDPANAYKRFWASLTIRTRTARSC